MDRTEQALDALVATLEHWTERLQLPRLTAYGVTAKDFDKVVANSRGSSMKTNPIVLTDGEIGAVLEARL
jgi:alcohol dehydrogenase